MTENNNIRIISAGAGSGKTYTISHKVLAHISKNKGSVRDVMVTTFTNAAAKELRERITEDLLKAGRSDEAILVDDAWIGTVHSLGKRLIDIFTFEAGYAPDQEVIPEDDEDFVFGQILAQTISEEDFRIMTSLAEKICVPDWQEDILGIVKKARENEIDLSNPQALADNSYQAFLDSVYQPVVKSGPLNSTEIQTLLNEGKNRMLSLSNARNYSQHTIVAGKIEELLNSLHGANCNGLEIHKSLLKLLTKEQTTQERQEVFNRTTPGIESCFAFFFLQSFERPLTDLVKEYLQHLFNAVSKSYASYVEYKKQRGLMDYSDQESEFLSLMKKESVKQYVRNKFKLLLVDEFQDTNPMQLAIFMQLASLIGEVFFVGDPKQSIYAFRGADPMLTTEVFKKLEHDAPLKTSRRSRHGLVDFTNLVFTDLFNNKDAALEKWDDLKDLQGQDTPIQLWNTGLNGNKEERIRSIIQHLRQLISHAPPFFLDKTTKEKKQLDFGQVAVLCKSNIDVAVWAKAFEDAGIQVSAVRPDFSKQAEIVFMFAALSYIADPLNSLAITELLVLGDKKLSGNMEQIIADRLEFLRNYDAWDPWMKENELISALTRIAALSDKLGVRELIEQAIVKLDLYGLAAAWGKPAVRKANLQKLLKLADEYEARCITWATAMSVQGFIQWIRSKDEIDQQPSVSPDAVAVMTYHKAKGLEWPLVILDGLDETPKYIWWGTYLETDYASFNVNHPLKDRKLFFLVNPFGKSYDYFKGRDTHNQAPDYLLPSILTTRLPSGREMLLYEENTRKIYVGMTRARDYLVLPSPNGSDEDSWWNRTAGKVLPEFFDQAASFQVNGTEIRYLPLDPASEPDKDNFETVEYFTPPSGEVTAYAQKYISPSNIEDETEGSAASEKHFVQKHRFSIPRLKGSHVEKDLGDAIHTIMASYQPDASSIARIEQISGIVEAFDLEEFDTKGMDHMAQELFRWIETNYPGAVIHREVPLRMTENGKVYSGIADMLVETPEGYILIDHKTYQGTDTAGHSGKYYRQLRAYEEMVNCHAEKKVTGIFLFYPVSGVLVELV